MAADKLSAPATHDARHAAFLSWRGLRFRASPLLMAYAALIVTLGALAAVVSLAGSAKDGGPLVALKLRPFPSASAIQAMRRGTFRDSREIGGHLVADPALMEDSPVGPLPRIARDGRTPMMAYGRAFDHEGKRPKIALVVRGLGVGAANTELALSQLSPEVTLGFAPFAPDLQSGVDSARSAGHEVLLEVPMEPFDFPDSDPGPHALLVAASPEENGKRIDWALSRATGYVGVMNLLGGRFMGEGGAIEPVLERVAKRGLLFFDNGASSSSVAITGARHVKAPIATGTLTLDNVQTQAAIDSKLAELENAARQDGFAIGVASAYPISIARLAEWAASADARGFQLVPVSGLAKVPVGGVASSE
jgi:polysaccharide deacetylase 2 family uncharacterized protein YibQ